MKKVTSKKVASKKVAAKKKATARRAAPIESNAQAVHTDRAGEQTVVVEEQESSMGVLEGAEPLARIEVGLGFTMNTGDYESIKGHVTLTVPVEVDEIDGAFADATSWVEEKLGELHDSCTAWANGEEIEGGEVTDGMGADE